MMNIPFYQEGKDLIERGKKELKKMRQKSAAAQLQQNDLAFKNPDFFKFLNWKYGNEPILERCSQIYPVIVYRAPDAQRQNLDSVLLNREEPPCHEDVEDQQLTYPNYRRLLERAGGNTLQNRRTFTMKEFRTEGQLGLRCGMGKYFECLDTCETLEWEIKRKASKLTSSNEEDFRRFERRLRQRSTLHMKVNDPIRSGRFRSVALSISTLIAYNHDGSFYLSLKRRSDTVATHANFTH
ncbi:MAG: hypothetical protein ACJ788_22925, partial [Ktedonobacteraceae bacterium]